MGLVEGEGIVQSKENHTLVVQRATEERGDFSVRQR